MTALCVLSFMCKCPTLKKSLIYFSPRSRVQPASTNNSLQHEFTSCPCCHHVLLPNNSDQCGCLLDQVDPFKVTLQLVLQLSLELSWAITEHKATAVQFYLSCRRRHFRYACLLVLLGVLDSVHRPQGPELGPVLVYKPWSCDSALD